MSRSSLNVPETQVLAAATRLTANDSGAKIVLALAGGFAVTLPPPEPGLEFEFFVRVAPTTAYTIVTHASSNIMLGQVLSNDLNAASDGDFEATGGDTFTFVANKAVKGDTVKFFCDGVNWFATAVVSVFDAATITTAS